MLLEDGSQEEPSVRSAMCCCSVAVTLRMSKDCLSSNTYRTWVLSDPNAFFTVHDCSRWQALVLMQCAGLDKAGMLGRHEHVPRKLRFLEVQKNRKVLTCSTVVTVCFGYGHSSRALHFKTV